MNIPELLIVADFRDSSDTEPPRKSVSMWIVKTLNGNSTMLKKPSQYTHPIGSQWLLFFEAEDFWRDKLEVSWNDWTLLWPELDWDWTGSETRPKLPRRLDGTWLIDETYEHIFSVNLRDRPTSRHSPLTADMPLRRAGDSGQTWTPATQPHSQGAWGCPVVRDRADALHTSGSW